MRAMADDRIGPILLDQPRSQSNRARPHTDRPGTRREARKDQNARRSEIPGLLVILLTISAGGYLLRDRHIIDPESGVGYFLGIAAGSMLLLVLLYPLRKRAGWLGRVGRVSGWFRLHMALGLIAPGLVLLHCNFQAGALNSNVALFALLTVAASGLVGRYLYSRIHRGLYGARARASDLLAAAHELRRTFDPSPVAASATWDQLRHHETYALELPRSTLGRAWHAILTRRRSRRLERALVKDCRGALARAGRAQKWPNRYTKERQRDTIDHVRAYFRMVNRTASLAVFERLFALWHVLHVPLFIVLVGTVVLHVVAVHQY